MSDNNTIAVFSAPRLPYHPVMEERFGVSRGAWKALVEAVYPNAKSVDSIAMALAYCQARKLDPFKRPVHIVPIYDSATKSYVDTVWPGISELRTTALRTKQYAGCDEVEFGPAIEEHFVWTDKYKGEQSATVVYPEWARMTVFRLVNGVKTAVVGPKAFWKETYATIGYGGSAPNDMWRKRPYGQIEKCAEAGALRRAFPEEIGDEPTAEEMEGSTVHSHVTPAAPRPSLSAGFGDEVAGRALEGPMVADADERSNDAGQSTEALSASTGAAIEGEIVETNANPTKRTRKPRERVEEKTPPTPEQAASDPVCSLPENSTETFPGNTTNSLPSNEPGPEFAEDEQGQGEDLPSPRTFSGLPASDDFPGDRGAPQEDAPNPLITALGAIADAQSWSAILATLIALGQLPEWKAADENNKTQIRAAAWARYVEIDAAGDEPVGIADHNTLFRFWLEFGATSATEIDGMWRVYYRGTAYKALLDEAGKTDAQIKAMRADKERITKFVAERKAALG